VHDRYQARVTWLVAFSALLIFASLRRQTETSGVVASRVDDATSLAVGQPGCLEKPQMN
jgi:hypothetical protein